MPSSELVSHCAEWFVNHIKKVYGGPEKSFDLLIPRNDLYVSGHRAILGHSTSHLWRFRPSALVIELDKQEESADFHIMVVVSSTVALKDVGELNCYARIMGASSGCVISPKGISNEVRLVQADSSVRNRLFGHDEFSRLFLIQWDVETQSVLADTVIPVDTLL